MTTQLLGIHHISSMTSDVQKNYAFFTEVLGMRLIKKTVNQDDIHTYHTYFADHIGTPGTTATFFDFPNQQKGVHGTNSISRIGLRVPNDAAIDYYLNRLNEFKMKNDGIQELFGKKILPFEDYDGQRYQLFSDEKNQGIEAGTPWSQGSVPQDKAIYGLGPVEITVSTFEDFKKMMQDLYGMTVILEEDNVALLEIGEGGNGGQVILRRDEKSTDAVPGYGEVHHVAFRVKDHASIKNWEKKYNELGLNTSGWVDRFYFEALYVRVGHVLIELSTDGPGFTGDELYKTLGESLALPPFLEPQRAEIESQVRLFDTSREYKE